MIRPEVEKLRGLVLTPEELDVILSIVATSKEMNGNNDIIDECNLLLQEAEIFIEKWLKEAGYTDGCVGARFVPVEGHQGRAIDFEYNGNIEDLDTEKLAASIAENVIDDRFSVRVFLYDKDDDVEYKILHKNIFCVEIWLNE